jgi:ADP-L-glycero-D-manno-heptose 6-epimerase
MMKICVTGNKGFIGKALQTELEKREGVVVVPIEEWIFDREPWQPRLKEYIEKLSPDAVFHVGACADTMNTNVNYMMTRNVESTMILADWCRGNNKPMIYSSSAAVEGSHGHPETLYAWSKYLGEKYVIACGGIALRYFNVYGSSEAHKGKMASIAFQSYKKDKWGEKVLLFPKKPHRDFVYVNDVVSANIHAWENYNDLNKTWYHVGSGQTRTFEDILNLMQIPFDYTSEDKIPYNYQYLTQADCKRFMHGWHPKYPLERGIQQYLIDLKITMYHPHL